MKKHMSEEIRNNKRTITIILVALMCILPIMSSDIYFPILPEITSYFHTSPLRVKGSLSVFLLGFAIGQLFYGALSDYCGRKKCLILGLVICLFSTLGCVIAPTIYFLNYSRFFQGFGACSGAIMGRAIIADSFDLKESAHIYTIIGPFIGLSPAVSPIIGGIISIYFSWQFVFIFLACFISILFVLIIVYLSESHKKLANTNLLIYFRDCLQSIRNREYLCYSSFVCGAYLAWFAFIVESSFLFSSYNLSLLQRSFLYLPLAIPYIIGNYIAKKFVKKMEINAVISKGLFFYNAGLFVLIIYAFIISKLILIMIGMFLIVIANGFLIPLGTAGAISSVENNKGTATAVLGFIQLALSSLGTYTVSFFETTESQKPLVSLIIFSGIIMWVCQKKLCPKEKIASYQTWDDQQL